jgi:hypothetical protein
MQTTGQSIRQIPVEAEGLMQRFSKSQKNPGE